MSGRTVTVTNRGSTIVLQGYKVAQHARHAGLRPIYSGAVQGWISDVRRVPDFLAFCQSRHIEVELVETS